MSPVAHQIAQKDGIVGMRTAALAPEKNLAADYGFELATDHLRRDADRCLRVTAAFEVTCPFFLVPVRAHDRLPWRQCYPVRVLDISAQLVQTLEPDPCFNAIHLEQRCRFFQRYAAAAIADADH